MNLESGTAHELYSLRVVIAAIGERTNPPWWRTQFLTEVGLRTITRIFPRTGVQSGIDSASKAARLEHNSRIGNGRYHLFRLPSAVESNLAGVQHRDNINEELSSLLAGELAGLL